MCSCVWEYVSVGVDACVCLCVFVYIHLFVYGSTDVSVFTSVRILYMCIFECKYMNVCECVCMLKQVCVL